MNRAYNIRKMMITASVVISVVIITGSNSFSATEKATVMKLSGNVLAMTPGGNWTPVSVGSILSEGTKIKTAKDSEVFLKWSGDYVVKVSGLTMLELTKMQSSGKTANSQISLTQGRVFSKVKKLATADSSFEVKTPAAIAGVRGTGFRCDFTPGEPAVFAVAEGSVSVGAAGEVVDVGEGMMSQVEEGDVPSEPEAIPPEQLEELQNDNSQTEEVADSEVQSREELKSEAEAEGETIEEDSDIADGTIDSITDVVDITQQAEEISDVAEEALQSGTLEIIIR